MARKLLWGIALSACLALLMAATALAAAPTDLPMSGGWVEGIVTTREPTQYRLTIAGAPQMVALEFRTDKAHKNRLSVVLQNIEENDEEFAEVFDALPLKTSGSSAVGKKTICLNPGEYFLVVYRNVYYDFGPYIAPFHISASATPVAPGQPLDAEPNDSLLSAQPISLGETKGGLVALADVDSYKLSLEQGTKLRLTFKQYAALIGLELYRLKDGKTEEDIRRFESGERPEGEDMPYESPLDVLESWWASAKLKMPFQKTHSLDLPAGTYYLCATGNDIEGEANGAHGFYELSLASDGAPDVALVLPESYKLPLGVSARVAPRREPAYFPEIPLRYNSSVPSVASVDPETGVVTPHLAGKTVISVSTLDGRGSASTKLTVLGADANRFSRKKPLRGDERDVFTSTKSLRYEGDVLVAEVFVYNRTKHSVTLSYLSGLRGAGALLLDLDGGEPDYALLAAKPLPADIPNRVLKPGKYATLAIRFDGVPGLNLANGRYNAVVEDSDYLVNGRVRLGKRARAQTQLTALLISTKSARIDPSAQPAG